MFLSTWGGILLALRFLGIITLSALLVTIILSETVHRHPIYMNFICTYLLYTLVMVIFQCVPRPLTLNY
jgi:hypothetical protein